MADHLFVDMKNVIAEKYSEISKYKSIDKITVTELVEACNISRQAFYYHFHDIMDLVVWLSHKRIQRVLELSQQKDHAEDAIKALVSFFTEYHEMIQKRMGTQMYRQFEVLTFQDIRTFLQGLAKKPEHAAPNSDYEAVLEYCTGGVYSLLLNYTGKSAETDAWVVKKLNQLIRGELSLL
jgi:AcrR family transcriptional regulator